MSLPARSLLLAITVLAVLFARAPAYAQEFGDIQVFIKPQVQIERSRHLRDVVRAIGKQRREAAGEDDDATEPLEYLPRESSKPLGAADPAGWTIWSDGGGSYLRDTLVLRGYSGSTHTISIGADKSLSDRVTLGFLINRSGSQIRNSIVPGGSETASWAAGPYAALFVTDTVVLTGSILHTWTRNGATSGAVVANWDSRDWTANATLTSYHQLGGWLVAPGIGLSFSEEREDAYIDSAATAFTASRTRIGTFAVSAAASRSFILSSGVEVEPSVSLEGEWTFLKSVTVVPTVPADTRRLDLTFAAGVDIRFSPSVSLSLNAAASGLAKPRYSAITGSARLSVSF